MAGRTEAVEKLEEEMVNAAVLCCSGERVVKVRMCMARVNWRPQARLGAVREVAECVWLLALRGNRTWKRCSEMFKSS